MKALENENESLSQNLEKYRQQLIEVKQSSASTQSQIEQSLKEKIVKLDRELDDTKKELRHLQLKMDETVIKLQEYEKETQNLLFA